MFLLYEMADKFPSVVVRFEKMAVGKSVSFISKIAGFVDKVRAV